MSYDAKKPGLKLDLACGAHCTEGYEGVDIAPCVGETYHGKDKDGKEVSFKHPDVKHVFSLMEFPWPFEDGSVSEVVCSHYIEHIPPFFWTPNPRYPIARDISAIQEGPHSVCLFLKFFDELHRVLEDGGTAVLVHPQVQNRRAFQDPTHTQFIPPERYLYVQKAYRLANGLEHAAYNVACNFEAKVQPLYDGQQSAIYPRFHEDHVSAIRSAYWGGFEDLKVTLTKVPAPVVVGARELATATS